MTKEIVFRSHAWHHFHALAPIFEEMQRRGYKVKKMVVSPKKILEANPRHIVAQWLPEELAPRAVFYSYGVAGLLGITQDLGFFKTARYGKGIMFNGTWWKEQYEQHRRYGYKLPSNWAIVGWAKNDFQHRPDAKKIASNIAKELGVKLPYSKTLYYVMGVSFYEQKQRNLDFLAKFTTNEKINLIVRGHPLDLKPFSDEINEYIKKLSYDHVSLLPPLYHQQKDFDMTKLFPLSDVMVCEDGSALWEFALTGKPAIQLRDQKVYDLTDEGRTVRLASIKVTKEKKGVMDIEYEEFRNFVPEYLKNPKKWVPSAKLTELKELCIADGHAVDRAIEFIVKVFEL